MNKQIPIPAAVMKLWKAHVAMCKHFKRSGLTFTLDGKLVGDIAEMMVADAIDLELCRTRTPGVDGHTRDGRSVQIKATCKPKAGPAFTPGEGTADQLIFVRIDFPRACAEVLYDGPEAPVRRLLPKKLIGTKRIPLGQVKAADRKVAAKQRLCRTLR